MKITKIKIKNGHYLYFWKNTQNKTVGGTSSTYPLDDPINHSRYLYDSLFFYKYKPKSGDIVVDIGCGTGEHLSYLSELVGSSGLVIGIEADPKLYNSASTLVSILNLKNVKLMNAAIFSDKNSKIFLSQEEHWIQNKIVSNNIDNNAILVNTISIDDMFLNLGLSKIDYIKMNIEGAEVDALIGTTKHFDDVKNWCISTHDFINIPTKTFVENFFNSHNRKYTVHPEVDGKPYVGGYIYSID